jgi:hypothetical protein
MQPLDPAAESLLREWIEKADADRAEILSGVDEAECSLSRGEGRAIAQESMRELAESVKLRGRARLAAERDAQR